MAANRTMGDGRPRLFVAESVVLNSPADPYLDLKSLAAYSGLSRRKLHNLLQDPSQPLPHYRIGGKILVRRSDFDAWALHYRQCGNSNVERIVSETLRDL